MNKLSLSVGVILASVGAASGVANAQNTVTLFGQNYNIQQFDYSTQVQWPSARFPGETLQLVEVEGACYAGNNRLIASSEAMAEVFPGELRNHIIEFELIEVGGQITGLQFHRTLVVSDFQVNGYELAPSGLTINTGNAGVGAGGNLVVGTSEENLRAFSLQAGSVGQLLPALPGQVCTPSGFSCQLDLTGLVTDVEDVTYVPGFNQRAGALYALNQEFPDRVLRIDADGTVNQAGSFNVGGDIANPPAANPNPTPKGLSYLADSSQFPASIRRPGGTIIVALDDDGPGLQVFDLSGNLVGYESLTVDGTPTGASRISTGTCSVTLLIESLAVDPVTGRIFLFNQGDGLVCNLLFVLSPVTAVTACALADVASDSLDTTRNPNNAIGPEDLDAFIAAFIADNVSIADVASDSLDTTYNPNGSVGSEDLDAFIASFIAGC